MWEQLEKEQKIKLLNSLRETIHLMDCTGYEDLFLKNQLETAEIKLTKECIKLS